MYTASRHLTLKIGPTALMPADIGDRNCYSVELRRGEERMSFIQVDRKGGRPTVDDILDLMLDDIVTYEDNRSFARWSETTHWNPKSKDAERQFRMAAALSRGLKSLLGAELFEKSIAEWKERHARSADSST